MNGTKLIRKVGEEGPKHDPYYFEEYTVIRRGERVMLHLGLSEYIEVNGYRTDSNEFGFYEGNDIEKIFEELTGMNIGQFGKYYQRIQNTCKECGCRDTYPMGGFPGETLYACIKCNQIVSADVNLGGII